MTRGSGDFFRCMQKIGERFCSRADNRTEVIGEKRGEDDTSLREGGSRSAATAKTEERVEEEGGCHGNDG